MSDCEGLAIIEAQYAARRPRSRELYLRAERVIPSGVTHDNRYLQPFPFYVARTRGSRKWDVDGLEYIDYTMGHGALLLGHQHPEMVQAVLEQAHRGTHYGACHELEVEWAELVTSLIPSADKVRFTSSGTEAVMMALRLARAFTGKDKFIKFQSHFHGWHDFVLPSKEPSSRVPLRAYPAGVAGDVVRSVVVLPAALDAVRSALDADPAIGAVIVEPTGASWATIPLPARFLQGLRDLTRQRDVLLIFDEVVTGFRWSKSGVQGLTGIVPDLTTLAKILAGGLPGGAVAGRADVMELLEFKGEPDWDRQRKIAHPGTFNANPLSAAAGAACLRLVSTGEHQTAADTQAKKLRSGMNVILSRLGVAGAAYGESSVFHVILGVPCPLRGSGDLAYPGLPADVLGGRTEPDLARAFTLNLIGEGVHFFGLGGLVSSAHTDEDVARTLKAFETCVARLQRLGLA